MKKFGTFRNMAHTDARDWKEFKGLGPAKIARGEEVTDEELEELAEILKEHYPHITEYILREVLLLTQKITA